MSFLWFNYIRNFGKSQIFGFLGIGFEFLIRGDLFSNLNFVGICFQTRGWGKWGIALVPKTMPHGAKIEP